MASKSNGKKTSSRRRLRMKFDDHGSLKERKVEIEPPNIPDPTEKEKEVYAVIESAFELGDDVARAAARFERDKLLPRFRENDESEEEFNTEEFQDICYKLSRLHLVKSVLPLYGLEAYEGRILAHFIDKAFGNSKPPQQPGTIFRGDDEGYLDLLARTQD